MVLAHRPASAFSKSFLVTVCLYAVTVQLNSSIQVAHPYESQPSRPLRNMNAKCPHSVGHGCMSAIDAMIFFPLTNCVAFFSLSQIITSLKTCNTPMLHTYSIILQFTPCFFSPDPAILGTILLSNPVISANVTDWGSRSIYQVTRQLIRACVARFATSNVTAVCCDAGERKYRGGLWKGIMNHLDYI